MLRRMEHVLILGATSAIAAEVAVLHAKRGDRLHLVGRNADKLAAVAARCAPAVVTTDRADFADLAADAAVIERAITALGHVDRALIAHGDLGDQLASEAAFADAEATLRANLTAGRSDAVDRRVVHALWGATAVAIVVALLTLALA